MTSEHMSDKSIAEPVDYEKLVDTFNHALRHTLRKNTIASSYLDFWVPDADPVVGIAGMVDSARIFGLTAIAIRFRQTTVPAERRPELERVLAKVCTLALETQGDNVLLRATDMQQTAIAEVARPGNRPKPTYWQADAAADVPKIATQVPNRWDSAELPEFSDAHPHFRPSLKAALSMLSYEGDAGQPSAGLVQVTGREGSMTLTLVVDSKSHTVRTARHMGATKPSERAILDLFCKAAENLPIQEVADHTGLKVLNSLVDKDTTPPVGGVLLPINAGAPFMVPPRLARQAYDAYRARTGAKDGTNFYYAPPAAEWQGLSSDQRWEKVDYVLRGFLQSEGLYPDDMRILRVEKNKYGYEVRVVVGFSDRVAVAAKPNLMRRLEQRLRRDAVPEIDLIADRAKDSSPLRRLS